MDVGQLAFLAGASFITGFSGALQPGPLFVATVMESIKRGSRAGPLLVAGHIIAESFVITVLAIGLSALMGLPTTKIVVGLLGGLFLLVSAFSLLRMARQVSLKQEIEGGKFILLKYGPIPAGLLISFFNPYFFVWWASVGNGFTLEAMRIGGPLGIVVFALAHWMSDLFWYTAVSMSMHKGRRVFSDKVYRAILVACGLFLIYLGADFVIGSLTSLRP